MIPISDRLTMKGQRLELEGRTILVTEVLAGLTLREVTPTEDVEPTAGRARSRSHRSAATSGAPSGHENSLPLPAAVHHRRVRWDGNECARTFRPR